MRANKRRDPFFTQVEDLDGLMGRLIVAGVTVVSPARRSEWGYRAGGIRRG